MKSVISAFFALSIALLCGCLACSSAKSDSALYPATADVVVGDRATLVVNQSAQLASGVVVRVDSIFDNRCPINAQCITAGQASAKLLVSKGSDQTVARLIVGRPNIVGRGIIYQDSTGARLGGQTYKIILRDVVPFPTLEPTGQTKRAVVQVTGV